MGIINNQSEINSANRCEPGSFPLRMARFPSVTKLESIDANIVAAKWVEVFNKTIANPDPHLSSLFLEESYWRDQLCLSWDFHTFEGPEKAIELIKKTNGSRIKSLTLDKSSALRSPTISAIDADGAVEIVGAFLTVETDVGSGEGLVRLVSDEGVWKVFTLFTFLKELTSYSEAVGQKRPHGAYDSTYTVEENWLDRRSKEEQFDDHEPTILIVGMTIFNQFWNKTDNDRCWTVWSHDCRSLEGFGCEIFDYRPREASW